MSDRGGVNNLIVILSIPTIIINLIIFNNILLAQSPDFQWAKQAGGTDSDIARDITTDGNNNSYITGGYNDQANFGSITLTNRSGVFNIFVAKYNEFGEVVWAKQASQNIDTWGGGAGNAIETDGSGNIPRFIRIKDNSLSFINSTKTAIAGTNISHNQEGSSPI